MESNTSVLVYITPLLLAYPLLTSLLRFRRHHNLHERYHFPTRESFSHMTDDQAWEIQKVLAQLEFPFIYIKALQFALFRVPPPSPPPKINKTDLINKCNRHTASPASQPFSQKQPNSLTPPPP